MPQTGTSGLSWKTGTGIVAVVAVMAVIAYLAYLSHKDHKETHILQTQQQLLMTAGSIVLGIEGFIDEHSDALKTISMKPTVQKNAYKSIFAEESPNHCVCEDLYEVYKDEVESFTILDAKGILLRRLPHIEERIGSDHSDKPGVAYVLREHKAHVSEVFFNNLGNLAVSILEPVFYNDEFAGMVRWMVQLDAISKRFIEPVKVGNKGYVWMFDSKQLIISHPQKDLVGVSMLDALKKIHTESGETFDKSGLKEHIREKHDYLNKVKAEEEGYGIFASCVTKENDIIAYKSISAGQTTWNVIITLPYSEIAGPIYKNARNIFGLAGIAILLFGVGGVFFFTNQKRKIELETETRYLKEIAESAEALQKAHDELETRVEKRTAELAKANEKLLIEIMDRERAREALKDSLSEKEVLLREIHHRVKNNLQIISSLLDMTSMQTGNQDAIDVIAEARARINTMALIHTLLYHSDRVDQIHMGSYVQRLVDYLSQVYGAKTGLVTPVIEPSDVYLAMRQAVPCSLVLNEVISNAFKHAFEEGQKGTIRISLQRLPNDRIVIRVKDDGIGIPEDIDIDKVESLGLRLTRNLVQEQLMGEIRFNRDMGTDIVIEFELLKEKNDNAHNNGSRR